jgi:DNA-binding TFAR19-related protein (PDSD5 family)
MKIIHMARPNEQRKVEVLLLKLAKMKPINSKVVPPPIEARTA